MGSKAQLKAESFGRERGGSALPMATSSTMREGRFCRLMICCRCLFQWNMEFYEK